LGESKILIADFKNDGKCPDAFFYIGTTTESPGDNDGIKLQYPNGTNRLIINFFSGRF
jgi:hypothetical protein